MKTAQRDFAQKRYYKVFREDRSACASPEKNPSDSFQMKFAKRFAAMCLREAPLVFPEEKITFTRTNHALTSPLEDAEVMVGFTSRGTTYNVINNVCPDYSILLEKGLCGLESEIEESYRTADAEGRDFLDACYITIDAIRDLTERYRAEAEKVGNQYVCNLLDQVPMGPARTFAEALQSIRIISSMFNIAGNYQLGFGRFDQYLIEFYRHDIEQGGMTQEDAKNLLSEFFLSLNKDSDLYFGVQQGDNGQSLMLGGIKPDGSSAINELTYLVLDVSNALKLIDPKINLRIDSDTPQDLLLKGCRLTRAGLGFPQYSNDEVVIPALVKAGYSLEDARNYTVAACWEFIIPGQGLDIVNQGAVSFPGAVNRVLHEANPAALTEEELDRRIKKDIDRQVSEILSNRDLNLLPSPLVSLFFHGAIQQARDVTVSAKYHNRGIHGAGSAAGADALFIARKLLREGHGDRLVEILRATDRNFEGEEQLLRHLREEAPKVGNAEAEVDRGLKDLFDWFADACEKHSTSKCHVRAGSGSAQFYVFLTDRATDWTIAPKVGATIDGRREGEPFPSSLAPSSGVKVSGLLSVLKSFSVIDYSRVMNGGPITVEFSPAALESDEGLEKLSDVIRYFVRLGNQQLQLNVLDSRVLEDAMKHPERHRNLVVRVWGWSGYFCELAPEFQRQIINRHKYSL